jgi:hypothetical protein
MPLGPAVGVLAWKRSDGSAESVAGITVFTVGAGCGRTRSEMMTISQMTSAMMTIFLNARPSSGFILSDSILPPIQYPCHGLQMPPLPGYARPLSYRAGSSSVGAGVLGAHHSEC